jgi:hypothetical protein
MTSTIPNYLDVSPSERGESFGGRISIRDYRMLAHAALYATQAIDVFMGIYPLDDGCGLDIWSGNRCLTIQVDSKLGHLCLLLLADIDSIDDPLCILSVDNSEESWRRLAHMAGKELQ